VLSRRTNAIMMMAMIPVSSFMGMSAVTTMCLTSVIVLAYGDFLAFSW
jgi:hypothetical protein